MHGDRESMQDIAGIIILHQLNQTPSLALVTLEHQLKIHQKKLGNRLCDISVFKVPRKKKNQMDPYFGPNIKRTFVRMYSKPNANS